MLDAARDGGRPGAGQRPHPRGHDADPRLRRRPPAHDVAAGPDLAGRSQAHRGRRVLGHAPRVRRDDPHREPCGSGTCTGSPRPWRAPSRTPASGRRWRSRSSTGSTPASRTPCAPSAERSLDALADAGSRDHADARAARHLPVSEKSLHWVAELSSERDLRVHIHLSETEGEVHDCVAAHGVRPAPYLDRIGLLTPTHDPGPRRVARRRRATRSSGSAARPSSRIPVSNLKLAVGRVFPYAKARRQGMPVGLGTDGASSNNSLDLFQDVKHLALRAEARRARPGRHAGDRGVGGRDR